MVFYQLKSGKNLEPWKVSVVRKVIFGNGDISRDNMSQYVRKYFDDKGTYVLVCSKVQLTPQQRTQSEEHIKKMVKECGYDERQIKVQVWGPDKVIAALKWFPSLSMRLTGRDKLEFQSHISWSNDAEMRRPLQLEEEQRQFIEAIRGALYEEKEAVHVSVFGETGVGKTRLILEATKVDELRPLVVYCTSATQYMNSGLQNEILKDDNDFTVILVVDECDQGMRAMIWNSLKYRGPRIKLITIYNDYEKTTGNTRELEAPKLSTEATSRIIQRYYDDKVTADDLAELCGGIPREAHALGMDVKNNPGQWFSTPDTMGNYFERRIRGGDDPNSTERPHLFYSFS